MTYIPENLQIVAISPESNIAFDALHHTCVGIHTARVITSLESERIVANAPMRGYQAIAMKNDTLLGIRHPVSGLTGQMEISTYLQATQQQGFQNVDLQLAYQVHNNTIVQVFVPANTPSTAEVSDSGSIREPGSLWSTTFQPAAMFMYVQQVADTSVYLNMATGSFVYLAPDNARLFVAQGRIDAEQAQHLPLITRAAEHMFTLGGQRSKRSAQSQEGTKVLPPPSECVHTLAYSLNAPYIQAILAVAKGFSIKLPWLLHYRKENTVLMLGKSPVLSLSIVKSTKGFDLECSMPKLVAGKGLKNLPSAEEAALKYLDILHHLRTTSGIPLYDSNGVYLLLRISHT